MSMMARIYFPSSVGQKRPGVDLTSRYIFEKSEKRQNSILVQTKNEGSPVKTMLSHNLMKLYRANMKIALQYPTINIGGDHSMAIATVAASLQKHGPNLKVIWFDAHGDINTRKTSPSGNFHGMPLAFLTGLDRDVTLFPFLQQTLSFDNILYLGIRDLDEGEKQVLKEKNIKFIKSADINKDPDAAFNLIRAFVGKDPVHLSFDVDGIDPSEMPCTGTVANRGVRVDAVKPILDKIMKKTNLINLDITEFNLEIGNEREKDLSISNFIKLFRKYL